MTKFFSPASAATKTAVVAAVVVVASTVLLVVYNTNSTAWHNATRPSTSKAGVGAGNKNHGLYSASVNSIAQQRQLQQQLQQQQQLWHQRRTQHSSRSRRTTQQSGEEVTVGGWHNYDADTAASSFHTATSNTDHHDTDTGNPLYESEMPIDDDEANNEQLYSSSPFHPRQYTGTGTSYMHYKHSKEQDTDGSTTFPPTFAPIVQYSGWFQPTLGPSLLENESSSNEPTLAPSLGPTLVPSRSPTKYPIMITLEPTKEEKDKDKDNDDDDDDVKEEEEENEWLKTDEPTMVPSLAPITEPTGSPSKVPTLGVSFV